MSLFRMSGQAHLMLSAAVGALTIGSGAAWAQSKPITVAPQTLASALHDFGSQTGRQIFFAPEIAASKTSRGVEGATDEQLALRDILDGTGLTFRRDANAYIIESAGASDPQSGSAAGDGAEVEALIVTAQKREENIQDVPIAMSAFTQEDLTRSQVAGGPDLITQVPNMTFTKTNFSSYSIQIRGIGTQAISATTDPAVAVAFNNTPFIRNHFFEQEFYDLQRVEVLRGPQGTLYGRNATGGVVNVISAKPKFVFEAKASGDLSNYNSSRIEGMVNIPLVEDAVALRLAGAWTKRDGYAENELTGDPIDGRDLWSTRLSLRMTPNDRIDANLIWEHFEENDDRLRSGKQLCKKHVITEVAGMPVGMFNPLPNTGQGGLMATANANFSQGCERESLYSPDSFQTPMGLMLPYYVPASAIGLPAQLDDPYANKVQSPDLRVIESTIDPEYSARSDLGELQVTLDLTDTLTFASETSYSTDTIRSLQDFNRFNTAPGAWLQPDDGRGSRPDTLLPGPNGGIFCDPQLGCSDRLVAVDISSAESRQFSQEFRLSSDFDGAFNFSLGANYLRYDTEDKYYVFINSLSMLAVDGLFQTNTAPPYVPGQTDNLGCMINGVLSGNPSNVYSVTGCTYIDPNSLDSLNDRGHNYFLSKNPYKLISYAAFGEAYYNISDNLKVTAGLRWTIDKKDAPRVPTWLLASDSVGYPVAEVIEQEWREPTGRLAIDWKPDLSFTDETLVYGSYAHGYKAGGANPPGFVRAFYTDSSVASANSAASLTRPRTFDAEFVDAFELGTKNTLADGKATLNLAAFYYDYKDYQISEIVDRSAFNRNFDATVWGVELEADWRPLENLRFGLKGGYEDTRIADGEMAIDLMDRTAGDPNWTVVRPFPTFASSCILPTWLMVGNAFGGSPSNPEPVLLGSGPGGGQTGCEWAYLTGVDPVTHQVYQATPPSSTVAFTHGGIINYSAFDPAMADGPYPGWDPATAPNNGEGIAKPLGGNQLPNAPHWTATITADYTMPLPNEWLATLHTDLHWQSESYWRVFQDHDYSTLDEYFTMNLAAIFTNEERGWNIMAYIKNVTDETAITGAFLNSDDTGLTTNVFLTEPRLYGLRVTKNWTGGPLLGSLGARRDGPYPFTLELDGQIQRQDAPNALYRPAFMSNFPADIDAGGIQNGDMDWGDGRGIKLTYAPSGRYSISLGARSGETNLHDRAVTEGETFYTCFSSAPCSGQTRFAFTNYGAATLIEGEEHLLVDFLIGMDVKIGALADAPSRLSAGLRYASFDSYAETSLYGTPDWIVPPDRWGALLSPKPAQHTEYRGDLRADRSFKGVGPVVTWDASRRLVGGDEQGALNIDWSVSGGALFGTRETVGTGLESSAYFDQTRRDLINFEPPVSQTSTPLAFRRSDKVTVPTVGASLGLAYTIGGVNIGAGYRWERYFDAIDGGVAQEKSYDRTIDGPYFKIAVGFGG